MPDALSLEQVEKRYGGHLAVHRLSLSVPQGAVYGILGPNGAGKSTTLRMAMNIIGPDRGAVRLLGRDPALDPAVLRRVGYLPEERGLYRKMRVLDVIVFFARLKGMAAGAARREAMEWLERMGLAAWARARVDTLSKGMQQKVQFISTVVHSPDLLVLDEPGSGLDPVNQEVLRETIRDANHAGRTVVLSTHNMYEAEQLCDSVCIIAAGEKVLDGPLREIRRAHRANRWRIEFERPGASTREFFGRPGLPNVTERGDGWEVDLEPGVDARGLMEAVARLSDPVIRFERVEPTLHEIFVERVGRDATPPDAETPRA